ncbi:carbohydrate-binding protein [Streptomyces sp. SKN60]|uniref:carbohydrate-binding protein n=1 Tax=Streptomyces sp. SKN60 TaxID=2855506 RepID=UPI00224688FA|nr:carbohydrate-binding protein [Streptomyces sp. SKN60]
MDRRMFLAGGAAAGVTVALAGAGLWTARPAQASAIGTGWSEVSGAYKVHQPPNVTRHTADSTGLHRFWLYDTDPSTFPGQDSGPRSELRFLDEYTSGSAQFECDMKISSGAHNVCVQQVFGGATAATAFMALAMNTNSINHYGTTLIHSPVYDQWIHLNVVHDAGAGKVYVYVNGQLKNTFNDRGDNTHYFKCGIYGRAGMSPYSEVFVKNIHLYRKSGGASPSPTPSPTSTSTSSPSPTPTPTGTTTWAAGVAYRVGDRVTYAGLLYSCLQAHTSQPGWEPPNVPALWQRV